jgi:hypothetical protein
VTNNPTPITNAYDGPTSFGGLQGQTYGMDAGSGSPAATGGEKISSDYLLYVRGEELPNLQRVLWLSVGAQQVVDPWYPAMQESWDSYEGDPFYWAFSSTPVPYAQQIILGQSEGSDGLVVTNVPRGAVMKVQLMVMGQSFDTLAPAAGNDDPVITANGIPLDPVNVNPGATFCVGQQVTFALNVPFPYTNAVVSFNMPPTFVNTNWQVNSSSSTNWFVNNRLLTFSTNSTPATTCWFTNGPGGQVTVRANLTRPNGDVVSSTTVGQFTIVKPAITDFKPQLLQVFFQTNGIVSLSAVVGFWTYVLPPYNFSGIGTYAQLVQSSNSYYVNIMGHEGSSTSGGYWLDNNYPYALDTPQLFSWSDNPTKFVAHNDNPGLDPGTFAFRTSIFITNQFKTYVQFQPGGGIPVTIGRVDWGWSCNATQSNGIWSWTCFTNQPMLDRNDSTLPTWTNIFHNN